MKEIAQMITNRVQSIGNSQLDYLLVIAKKTIEFNESLEEDVYDLVSLCIDEIEEGGSIEHEIQLCIGNIEELLNEVNS